MPSVELTQGTRLYSPDFLEEVFGWNYEEMHRAAIADYRTQRFLDLVAKWEIRKRGINPQLIIVNRLYPNAIYEGRPDLIESAIPTGFINEHVYSDVMPMAVFVDPSTRCHTSLSI